MEKVKNSILSFTKSNYFGFSLIIIPTIIVALFASGTLGNFEEVKIMLFLGTLVGTLGFVLLFTKIPYKKIRFGLFSLMASLLVYTMIKTGIATPYPSSKISVFLCLIVGSVGLVHLIYKVLSER